MSNILLVGRSEGSLCDAAVGWVLSSTQATR